MVRTPPSSLIIVGGGIVGLVLAVAARARGHAVTLIARDPAETTASGIAAGMVAPALEALHDADPTLSFRRLQAAQAAWIDQIDLWPAALQEMVAARGAQESLYVWEKADGQGQAMRERLNAMGAAYARLTAQRLRQAGLDPDRFDGLRLTDDWLIEAKVALDALRAHFIALGGVVRDAAVSRVASAHVVLDIGAKLEAEAVVVAAGYGSKAFAADVPVLGLLEPIKGHVFDIDGRGGAGVLRGAKGYFADYGAHGKFGASMQPGQGDLAIEPEIVAGLRARAVDMGVDVSSAIARTGIRAASPDGWPLIGRDPASGVLVATAMRRNGYVFAPLAARIILALIEGSEAPEGDPYWPDRF